MVMIGQKKYIEALKILKSLEKDYSHRKLKRVKYYKALCLSRLRKRLKEKIAYSPLKNAAL